MSKITNQDFFLQHMIDNCDLVIFTNLPEPIHETAKLASVRVEVILSPASFSLGIGDESGRKLSILSLLNATVVGTGAIQHANFFSGITHIHTADRANPIAVSSGVPITIDAFDVIELTEPS